MERRYKMQCKFFYYKNCCTGPIFGFNFRRNRGWYQTHVHPFNSGNGKGYQQEKLKIGYRTIHTKCFNACYGWNSESQDSTNPGPTDPNQNETGYHTGNAGRLSKVEGKVDAQNVRTEILKKIWKETESFQNTSGSNAMMENKITEVQCRSCWTKGTRRRHCRQHVFRKTMVVGGFAPFEFF